MQQDFNPDQNPFTAILNASKSSGASMQGPQGSQGPQTPPQAGPNGRQLPPQIAGMAVKTPPNQLDYGSVGGTTPQLTQALQAMQKFIAESQDPNEIAIGRQIIVLMTQLITRDQQKQVGQLAQGKNQG